LFYSYCIFYRTKKPGGGNTENKMKKVKLVSKTIMRKKSEHTRNQVENSHDKILECTLENSHKKIRTYSEPSEKRPNERKATRTPSK
jgi:hypothetical protein